MNVKAIVTDIEGTTSSIGFVHDVLFPYATEELPDFVRSNQSQPEISILLDDVRNEAGQPDASTERVIELLLGWIEEDRKVTSLKTLQGHIWQRGYESGDFTGHMYEDAAIWLRRWFAMGIDLYVYSSGSVGAQKLLFGYCDAGDLRPLFSGYFDTNIGHKKEAASYKSIVESLNYSANDILFLSDVAEELDAASDAGIQTIQLVRKEDVVIGSHAVARSFDEVIIGFET